MARTIAQIEAQIVAKKNTEAALAGLDSPSQTATFTTWIFIQAVAINLFEQVLDIYKTDLEAKIATAAVGSDAWLQDQVFKFQYDSVTPQVLEVGSDWSINYPTVDATKRIVTRCSVKTTGQRVVLVKVAKSDPPVAFSGGEISSITGFLSDINPAGVNYIVQSLTADKLYLAGSIYYNGQYASVVSDAVIAAINAYLAAIPFNGSVRLLDLDMAIRAVTGVTDVVLSDVAIRADLTAFVDKTYLVQNKQTFIPLYQTYAGYIVEETTSGETFVDKLNFVAQ